jgi:hypothetical protein
MSKALRHSHLNPCIAVALIDPVVSEPIRPAPDTERCQAYIFDVDAFTQRRISELREEIAALQHQNVSHRRDEPWTLMRAPQRKGFQSTINNHQSTIFLGLS